MQILKSDCKFKENDKKKLSTCLVLNYLVNFKFDVCIRLHGRPASNG